MATVQHSNLTGVNAIHVPYAGQYATAAARETASDVSAADEGKLFRQLDDNSLWMLVSVSPLKWHTLGGGRLAGEIIIFSGTFGGTDGKRPIPKGATDADEGWALCDGSNGTPDLRGRFIIGAGESYAQGTTGGAASAKVSGSVSGTTGATTLTIEQIPSHMHTTPTGLVGVKDSYYFFDGDPGRGGWKSSGTNYVGGSKAHTHSMAGTLSATVNTLPPYYALAYIMKLPTA